MDYERARRFFFWVGVGMGLAVLIIAIASHLPGCLEFNDAVQDVNTVATTAKTVLDSPAGKMIPPDLRFYGSLVVSAVMAGAAGYKQWRLAQMSKTTKAIVRGVEASEDQPGAMKGNPTSPTKTAIAAEMRKLGIYDAGNKIVERLKIS